MYHSQSGSPARLLQKLAGAGLPFASPNQALMRSVGFLLLFFIDPKLEVGHRRVQMGTKRLWNLLNILNKQRLGGKGAGYSRE